MSQRSKIRVLVIDDDEGVCTSLTTLLEADGYSVTTCTEPRSALPEIKENHHQLVLLDVRMPEIDGVRMLQEIRAIDSELCVIAISDFPEVETAVQMLKLGAYDFLRKPFDPERLRGLLRRAVREKGLSTDAEQELNRVLGARIRGLRKDRQLTLKQLANKTSLSVSLISQIELGKSAASISTLRKLSAALGSPIARLFDGI